MAESLRLSIVTVTYKDRPGLEETLRSLEPLAGQGDWEHVVVDSSPEVNAEVIAALRARGWPLRHVASPPEGIYAAINKGIESARGRQLWFLNGGDLLHDPKALATALETIESETGLEFLASTVEFTREGKHMYLHRPYPFVFRSLLGLNRLCHQGIVYKREVFAKVGLYSTDLKLAADYEHHLRCLAAGVRIGTLPYNTLAVYDMSGSSMDYKRAFAEFELVQRRIGPRLPRWFNAANRVVRPLEYAKIATMKGLEGSPLAAVLKPLWIAFKRNHYR